MYKNLLAVDSNPYKFSVYRAAAQNVGTAATKITYDTENFDTNNNFATGTYTAPVNGFYQFNSNILTTTAGTGTTVVGEFYKNGSVISRMFTANDIAGANPGYSGSTLLQLSATNTVEVYVTTVTAAKALEVSSAAFNSFSGFLVSRT